MKKKKRIKGHGYQIQYVETKRKKVTSGQKSMERAGGE